MDMKIATTMPHTAETAKIANRKDSATVVWLTCRNRVHPKVMEINRIAATVNPIPRPEMNRTMLLLYPGTISKTGAHFNLPKKPEEWLEVASPSSNARGIFKLFLGYAPGVGKTYSMLSEAIRRKSRGEDVVIGIVETHGRKGVVELAEKLDRVPPRKLE